MALSLKFHQPPPLDPALQGDCHRRLAASVDMALAVAGSEGSTELGSMATDWATVMVSHTVCFPPISTMESIMVCRGN